MIVTQTRPASRCYFPGVAPSGPSRGEWVHRSANFVVSYCALEPGQSLEADTRQEYMLYVRDGAATMIAGDQAITCAEPTIMIAPPGESRLEMRAPGRVLRVFAAGETAIAGYAMNAAAYADGADEVAPAVAWPEPDDGFSLRHYKLANYAERKMRLFRCTNLMINVFDFHGPRDPEALSPHSHDDFEQGSFAMDGEWIHSLRYPWSKRMSDWREDEHLRIASPSLLVIPAGVVHTSRSIGSGAKVPGYIKTPTPLYQI